MIQKEYFIGFSLISHHQAPSHSPDLLGRSLLAKTYSVATGIYCRSLIAQAYTAARAHTSQATFILVRDKNGRFGKIFLALSRDVGTGRVHRDSEALCHCKSGTGPRPGITSASPGIVFVIAALD